MNKDERKATKDEFLRYEAEISRLVIKLGMNDWEYKVLFAVTPEKENDASFCSNNDCTMGYFYYNPIQYKNAGIYPEKSAKHEVAHMIMARVNKIARERFIESRELYAEMEKIATILEKVL